MLDVSILAPVVKKTVSVKFVASMQKQLPKAILLGASGERLKTFVLTQQTNELPLDGFAAGSYTLRVESGNEVVVKQIIIPL